MLPGLQSSLYFQAYKHMFMSLSSVDQEPRAMRSGNVHIHGMWRVMKASIAYVITQVIYTFLSNAVVLINCTVGHDRPVLH